MKLLSRIISPFIKGLLSLVCNVDASELIKVSFNGPIILVINHINFLEVPLVYTYLFPRNLASIVKKETWKNPVLGFLGYIWEAIPLDRKLSDIAAMRKSLQALQAGRILLIAPEGTRSGDGKLQYGHAGVVQIALHSGASFIPIAHFGGEKIWVNLKSFRKTNFKFRVGKTFRIKMMEGKCSKEDRILITNEIMNRISLLLPEDYRGVYSNPENNPFKFTIETGEQ